MAEPALVPLWLSVVSESFFPQLDTALRAGKHISNEQAESFLFISKHLDGLSEFYERYGVELIRAPEQFYYLRPKTHSILPRSLLTPFEVLIGKTLCLLHLSPRHLQSEGLFHAQDVMEMLFELLPKERLLKFQHPRAGGSAWDQAKFQERVKSALLKLRKLGMIAVLGGADSSGGLELKPFRIQDSIFRFSADVKEGTALETSQRRMIQEGEAVMASPESPEPMMAEGNTL